MATISTINLSLVLVIVSASGSSCSANFADKTSINAVPQSKSAATPSTTRAAVRSIDFANFTYPGQYIFAKSRQASRLVKERELSSKVVYEGMKQVAYS